MSPHPVARVSAALVGRDDVLALAARRLREAERGAGQFLLIAGEAGIGKSRMLDEIAGMLPGVSELATRAWPRDAEFPGAVLFDLARDLRQAGRPAAAELITGRLNAHDPAEEAPRRYRMLVADLAGLAAQLLAETPTLLRIEDLHWADEMSLDVLEHLAPLVRHSSSLVVATYRSDEVRTGSALATWRSRVLGQRFAEEVTLARLDLDATVRLAEALLGEVPASTFVDRLLERSNGIPLYIEELIAAGGTRTVPGTIAEAVRQRAARLEPAIRELADTAAVIGCSFDLELVADILDRAPDEVEAHLRELCENHLLVRLSDTRYDYRHALLRDALYDDIPVTRRRPMHAGVASASERAGMRHSYLSEQFELAGLPELAHAHALAAADEAARISAHREAAELYARALRTAPPEVGPRGIAELCARGAHELASIDEPGGSAELLERAIPLYRAAGDVDAAVSLVADLMGVLHPAGVDLDRRIALAREARDWLAAEPGGGSDHAWGRLLAAEASAYMLARQLDAAIASGELALARTSGGRDRATWLDVQSTIGVVQVFGGNPQGWALFEQVIDDAGTRYEAAAVRGRNQVVSSASVLVEYDIAERFVDEALEFTAATERWDRHHYLRAHRGHVRWATGAPGAERDARSALADGHAVFTQLEALKVLGYVDLARDRLDSAHRHLTRSLQLGRGMDELQRISPALWGLAEVALHTGDAAAAAALAEEGYALSAPVGDAAYLFPFVLTGTRALLALHDVESARDWVGRTGAVLRRRGISGTLPALPHADGLLALAEGRTTTARPLLRAAAEAWSARRRTWEGTHALLDLARCAARARRPGEAARYVAEGRRRAEDSGALLLLRLADGIPLDPEGDEAAGPLTAREFEVARLVAAGATNRAIAEQLVIAPKTASAHVEHILAKLGVARRAEIAAWVARAIASGDD